MIIGIAKQLTSNSLQDPAHDATKNTSILSGWTVVLLGEQLFLYWATIIPNKGGRKKSPHFRSRSFKSSSNVISVEWIIITQPNSAQATISCSRVFRGWKLLQPDRVENPLGTSLLGCLLEVVFVSLKCLNKNSFS